MNCPNCKQALKMLKIPEYKTAKQHIDKKLYSFVVKDVEFPHCDKCNLTFQTNVSEQKVNKAFKKFLKDNNITVYADDLIDSYLVDVPETDRKRVRDVLCDIVFFNFSNLSYQQLRPEIQDLVSQVDIKTEDTYNDKYKDFMLEFLSE